MQITSEMVMGLIAALFGFINLWFWFDKNREAEDKKALWAQLNELKKEQASYMTRPEVKEMMFEALAPIKEEQAKSVSIMRNIETMIRQMEKEFAVTKFALFNRGNGHDSKDNDC